MKSALALFAGLVVVILLTTIADVVMHASGAFPTAGTSMTTVDWMISTAYRIVISIFGCWVAARLAPKRPMRHALILGAIGTAIAIAGVAATWNSGPEFGPRWYPIALVLTALPCAWIGGRLRERQVVADGISRHEGRPQIARHLRARLAEEAFIEIRADGMARYAIPNDHALGVRMADIQRLGKELGLDHALALELWKTRVYEARMLCAYVDDPARVTSAQMDKQARDFDNWAICDTLCFALWVRTPTHCRRSTSGPRAARNT